MKLYVNPSLGELPERGGVRKHMLDLYECIRKDDEIYLTMDPEDADIVHIESGYRIENYCPDIYVCHGGFVPKPLKSVMQNVIEARKVILVAKWILKFIPKVFHHKCIHIPNGVFCDSINADIKLNSDSGYMLYAKEWNYHFDDFKLLVSRFKHVNFMTTYWPEGKRIPPNVNYVGLLNHKTMMNCLANAGCLVLTGSEVNPIMLLEAWSLGIPVLAKDIDGSKEVMEIEGKIYGGRLYNKDNICNQLQYVLSHRERLGQEGFSLVRQKYDWSNIWKRYKVEYRNLF